jgi:hypothetical protein
MHGINRARGVAAFSNGVNAEENGYVVDVIFSRIVSASSPVRSHFAPEAPAAILLRFAI